MPAKEKAMIELTKEQAQAVARSTEKPPLAVDPLGKITYALVRKELYDRLTEYDDEPWTEEEMALLAGEAGEMLDSFGKNA